MRYQLSVLAIEFADRFVYLWERWQAFRNKQEQVIVLNSID